MDRAARSLWGLVVVSAVGEDAVISIILPAVTVRRREG